MELSIQEVLEGDILVIGSGGAGAMAALEASKYINEVILVSKGEGSTDKISAMNVPLGEVDPRDNPKVFEEDILKEGENLNDPNLVRMLAEGAKEVFNQFLKMGVPFDREDNKFKQRLTAGNSYPRSVCSKDILGKEILACLRREIGKSPIKFLDGVMAVDLIEDRQRIVGILGIDLKTGNFLAMRAKTTILATGGAGQLYEFTTNSKDITGDGYALGYRCRAKLVDMEFIQFEPTVVVYPHSVRGLVVPTALFGEGALLLNSKGERFMLKYDKDKKELTSKSLLARAIFLEISKGYGTSHGGVFFDVSIVLPKTIEEGFPSLFNQLFLAGVNIRGEPLEVAPACHYIMGGLKINEFCQTTIPGLFAAGEVSGGIHGANRLSGNSATDIFVFGSRAGKFAAREAQSIASQPSLQEFFQSCQKLGEKIYYPEAESLKLTSESIRGKLKKIMWDYVGLVRDKRGLTLALEEILHLKEKLEKVETADIQKFKENLETKNLLTVAEIVIQAAIFREESRGAHYRSDFPQVRWERLNLR